MTTSVNPKQRFALNIFFSLYGWMALWRDCCFALNILLFTVWMDAYGPVARLPAAEIWIKYVNQLTLLLCGKRQHELNVCPKLSHIQCLKSNPRPTDRVFCIKPLAMFPAYSTKQQ